jgi:hypothetical protein
MNEGTPLGSKSTVSHKASVLNKAPQRNVTFTFYDTIFANLLEKFKVLGCLMSLKIHFLNSHLDFFGAVSEGQGERFHKDIKEMERRYRGWWNVNMMGDCCWTLQQEIPETSHKNFAGKRKRQYKAIE